jgi:hypothetical protein
MAQDRWINITLDPNAASKADRANDRHGKALGASAAGDLTISFDTSKLTSLSLFRSAVAAAVEHASSGLKP